MPSPKDTLDRLWLNCRLAEPAVAEPVVAEPTTAAESLWAIGVHQGLITLLQPMSCTAQVRAAGEVHDARGAWVTPGLIDCHTHLLWAGNRAGEIALRLQGVDYSEIARRGGGILSTVRSTRAATEEELVELALPRLRTLAAEGVTTIEIKSGYGLTLADELKLLRAARRLSRVARVTIRTTLLAAHAVPPEFASRADDYVALICDRIMPAAAEEGLADAVDVFCEHIGFSVAQCERVFEAAGRLGLRVKGHMEQLSCLGGSRLAARFNALSVDHVEYLDTAGIEAIARAGTVAVLLPGAWYFLRETQKPPVAALRSAGVPMAVATDLNPGTSPLASLRLMMNMACVHFGLTPLEALTGVTLHAARALGLAGQTGELALGRSADFLVWDSCAPAELACDVGLSRPRQRVFKGEIT